MRLALALGAALVATTMVAYADSDHNGRNFVFHRGPAVDADSNSDGWLSRAEVSAEADRLFADLDRDNNGRLTDEDSEILSREVEAEVERAMEGVRVEMENMDFDVDVDLEGLDEEIERNLSQTLVFVDDEDCETTTEERNGQRTVTRTCRSDDDDRAERARDHAERARDHAERARDRAERNAERRVHVIRHGCDGDVLVHPVPPIPPVPPVAHMAPVPPVPPVPHIPAFWMGYGDSDESDLNGDGWLSREEFRDQQLRFFDARDANRDGRVRYEEPPEAPEPPRPPRHR
jgi:hypothetical protein